MQQLPPNSRHARLWLTASLAALALAGCNKADQQAALDQVAPPQAALPLTTADLPAGSDAPAVQALPAGAPARVVRLVDPSQRYAYVDRAYRMSDAFADAPPDYSFDYDGVRPWIWRSDSGAYRVLERTPGGERYYYYEAGEDLPFLIRDPDYAYGYDRGQLVVVYDRQGRVLPYDLIDQRADFAGRYLVRAAALYQAVRNAHREAVARGNWIARQRELAAERRAWQDQQARDADWRAFHALHEQEEHDRWAEERWRRQAEAARVFRMLNDRAESDRAWRQARDEQSWLQQRRGTGRSTNEQGTQSHPAPSGPSPTDRARVQADQAQAARQAQAQAKAQAEANARTQQSQQIQQAQAEQRRIAEDQARQRHDGALKSRVDQQAAQAQARSQADSRMQQDRAAAMRARADQQAAQHQAAKQAGQDRAAAMKARLDQQAAHAAQAQAEQQSHRQAAQQDQGRRQAAQQAAIAARKTAATTHDAGKGHPQGDHHGKDDHKPDRP